MFESLSNAWWDITLSKSAYFAFPRFTDFDDEYRRVTALQWRIHERNPHTVDLQGADKVEYDRLLDEKNQSARSDGILTEKILEWKDVEVHIRDETAIFLSDRTYRFEYGGSIAAAKEKLTVHALQRLTVGDHVFLHGFLDHANQIVEGNPFYLARARVFSTTSG